MSAFPCDGTFPTGTAQWEKRNLALEIPVWDTTICIQCGKCAMVCPHAVIRVKVYDSPNSQDAPATFKSTDAREQEWEGFKYTLQVAPEDCTGCGICVEVCPAQKQDRDAAESDQHGCRSHRCAMQERENWDFFLNIPELDRRRIKSTSIRQQQVQRAAVRILRRLLRLRRNTLL